MRVMPMREFLRGGYRGIKEMTVVTNHGRPVGTWVPQAATREQGVDKDKTGKDRNG